jgi:hypothetical protein
MIFDNHIDEERHAKFRREDIEACEDVLELCEWYDRCWRKQIQIKGFIDAWREAEIEDEEWFLSIAGALAYTKIGLKHIERRILTLGGTPPYCPTDPRSRQLRLLHDQVEKLKRRVDELERESV